MCLSKNDTAMLQEIMIELPISTSKLEYSFDENKAFLIFSEFSGDKRKLNKDICSNWVCLIKDKDTGLVAGFDFVDLEVFGINKEDFFDIAKKGAEFFLLELCSRSPGLAKDVINLISFSEHKEKK